MIFSKSVTAESMAETIRSTDPIKQCAELIRQSLLDTDFELNDRFCDANDLKTSWNNVNIPEPLLKFFEALYRFDATETNRPTCEDEQYEQTTGVGLSENRSRQMQGLFQITYHDLHQGRKRTSSFSSKSVSNKDCLISSAHCLMGSVERMVSAMLSAVTLLLKNIRDLFNCFGCE